MEYDTYADAPVAEPAPKLTNPMPHNLDSMKNSALLTAADMLSGLFVALERQQDPATIVGLLEEARKTMARVLEK